MRRFSKEAEALRASTITATDAGKVLGLVPSSWGTAMDVWLKLKGEAPPFEQTERMEWGLRLEEPIAQRYAENRGLVLTPAVTVRGPEDWMSCTPDFYARGAIGHETAGMLEWVDLSGDAADPWLVEVKTASVYMRSHWGEPGTEDVPPGYRCQAVWQMACLPEIPRVDFAVLFGGQEGAVYTIPRDEEEVGAVREALARWWRDYVVADIPPPIDASDRCAKWLDSRWQPSGTVIEATEDDANTVRAIAELRDRQKALAEQEARLKNELRARMGDASKMKGDGWSVSYTEVRGRVDEKAHARSLGGTDETAEAFRGESRRQLTVRAPKLDRGDD